MRIFIDESGNFSGFHPGSISVVGALAICDHRWDRLSEKYNRLRKRFPKMGGEVKGRLLSEEQIDAVVCLLRKNEAIFEVTAIDVGIHIEVDVLKYKGALADAMSERLEKFKEPSRSRLTDEIIQIRKMSAPLFMQAMATFDVLENIITHVPLYIVQRYPQELGQFSWIVDGKDADRITAWEKWWSWYGTGVLANRSKIRPRPALIGADYSHFRVFDAATREDGVEGTDLSKLMADLRFSSVADCGLEMVDILVNAIRRALTRKLQKRGWENIPGLMINRESQCISVMHLEGATILNPKRNYEDVLEQFIVGGRSMLTRSNSLAAEEEE